MEKNKLEKFIYENFDKCVRTHTRDDGTLIGLPYPYTVPCIDGAFQEMYYWDTYFTNAGMIRCGNVAQARSNVDNMLYLINKYGYMPNGNRTYFLRSSQPPFLSLMVRDVYAAGADKEWLKKAEEGLEKEYAFWNTRRITETGLNRYGYNPEAPGWEGSEQALEERLGFKAPIETAALQIEHFNATAESGWDFTPRWEFEAFHYIQVDLNSLLYAMEKNIAFFRSELGLDRTEWEEKAALRKQRIQKLLWNETEGIFTDYNFKKSKFSPVCSAASFYPLFVGLATEEEARKSRQKLLAALETEHGLYTCAENGIPGRYQWNAPNGWAPLHFVAIKGLLNYGFTDDAKRIARKYIETVERNFARTGTLWEKYNVEDGTVNVENEYEMPPMLGWTAGTYLYAREIAEAQ